MLAMLWKIRVNNVIILFERDNNSIAVETFIPFNSHQCNDTRPVVINEFKDGRFVNYSNFFPNNMKNLQQCPIRVAITNDAEPYIFIRTSNESVSIYGGEIDLVNALAQSINSSIKFSYNYSTGNDALQAVFDGYADLSIATWWLKPSRSKLLDSSTGYFSDTVAFVVPPGKDLTAIEKLYYPFSVPVWGLVGTILLLGIIVILVIKHQSTDIQEFIFGTQVKTPIINMFAAFIGGTQQVLPKRTFSRFLLIKFLIFSLVIRTVYQGLYYQLLKSNKRHEEVQSVDEMFAKDFKFYVGKGVSDIIQGSDFMQQRYL